MLSNRLAFVALAIACIGAAAGGGYLATRQNTVPAPVAAQSHSATPAAEPAALPAEAQPASPAPPKPVQETEAVVGDTASRTPAATAKTTPRKSVEETRAVTSRQPSAAQPVAAHQEPTPALTSSWPASAGAQLPVPAAPPAIDTTPAAPRPEERAVPEPAHPAEPPARTFAELVVSADSVVGLQTESRVSSESARVEDRVDARVTRDVKVGDRVAIPAGTRAIGSVMQVERGGKFKEKARLGIRFHTLVLADGTRIPIATETIFRDGEGPGASTSQKMGGAAVGGAILGAILGGGKGMAIGAAAGAGAGGAAVAAGDRNAATLPAGSPLTVRLVQPITVTSERN
jgi:type IV secretory pathway VirB10-like protein